MIPYGRQTIEQDDIDAVVTSLKSDFLTQGPRVEEFETALAQYGGAAHAVVFANGTLALMAAYSAAGLSAGHSFVTTPLTFAATSSAGVWLGASPLFCDVSPQDGNLTLEALNQLSNAASAKLLVSVDFAGKPVDYDALREWCAQRKMLFISDACHALGASYKGKKVGGLADMTVFSFHPVKSITTGEGGAVLTNNKDLADKLRQFRHHGIKRTPDYYEVVSLGTNGRLTDFQSALGLSQLRKLDRFMELRRQWAQRYSELLSDAADFALPMEVPACESAWHLYQVRLTNPALIPQRWSIVRRLREAGIGAQVHYEMVSHQPYFVQNFRNATPCPNAEHFSAAAISLPIYPTLKAEEVAEVCTVLKRVVKETLELVRPRANV